MAQSTTNKTLRGKLADPKWRRERAKKASEVGNGPAARYKALRTTIARRRGELTPEQIAELRGLLAPAGGEPA